MPRQSHYNRQFLIYLPTEKDLDNWKELAKTARISLNKYIFEMVERGRQEAQLRTDALQIKKGDIDKDELELAQDMASLLLGIMRRGRL